MQTPKHSHEHLNKQITKTPNPEGNIYLSIYHYLIILFVYFIISQNKKKRKKMVQQVPIVACGLKLITKLNLLAVSFGSYG